MPELSRLVAIEPSTVRAVFLAPMIRELGSRGVPIDSLLRRRGLSVSQLANPYERVPLCHFVGLAEDAAARLQRPFFGLELGKRFNVADLGPFYAMLMLARDLRSALTLLSRFQAAWQTNTVLEFKPGVSTSVCRYLIQDPSIWPRRQDAEFTVAALTAFIRELTGRRWRPLAVEFEHEITDRIGPLGDYFNAPVYGNCHANQLIIATSDLGRPMRGRLDRGEDEIVPILERHVMELLGSGNERALQTAACRADALIARRLGRAEVTIEAVAGEMHMSVRSLRRHLTQEGTSFRQILQMHRRARVEALLRSNGMRLADLSNQLGYSDSTVLSRAFKIWTGMSPRMYAKSQRSRSPIVEVGP